jgi:hypothetical protein
VRRRRLKDEHVTAARKSLDVMIELWRRKVRAVALTAAYC